MSTRHKQSNNLAYTRKARGLRAKQIAKAVGISLSAYKNYESGNRFPRPEIARRIADFLGVSVDWLFFRPSVDNLAIEEEDNRQDGYREGIAK